MTLRNHILQFESVYWDYYQRHHDQPRLANPFIENGNHGKFIDEYFRLAGKEILIHNFPIKVSDLRRPSHVTSTFFLGLLIIHRCNIELKVPKKNLPGYDALPFIWFLATLFHDFAENLERNQQFVNSLHDYTSLCKLYHIEHDLLQKQIENVPPTLFKSIQRYFALRREDNKIDHGIHAGTYMFDALVKNRVHKKSHDLDNHLLWDESLDDQYALAAASIAIHNIWVGQKNLNYSKFGLEDLKLFKGYSVEDYPLPYVFGLVDTIDPIKFFCFKNELNFNDVLTALSLKFSPYRIDITNNGIAADFFLAYVQEIRTSLKNWLNHKISRRKNVLRIDFT